MGILLRQKQQSSLLNSA